MEDQAFDSQDIALETPAEGVFRPPSVLSNSVRNGVSYSHISDIPAAVKADMSTECVLGIDEAGRGPVLGPMVYAVFYLPRTQEASLLSQTHHFDDSKVLTPVVRSSLMEKLCTPGTDLHTTCGWAARLLSAQDISSGMLRPAGAYNLNAQAMDATVELIQAVLSQGVNLTHIYVDTIGKPEIYQKKLERIFPSAKFTVAKKADSLYPCVSAASVCAKVTRDAALDVCAESYPGQEEGWGSGYPSDARCSSWLKRNMDPVFGWGSECRFSWGTAKELLEVKGDGAGVKWPADDQDGNGKMTDFFIATRSSRAREDYKIGLAFDYRGQGMSGGFSG
ncbi:hypothetical protein EJ06DRAFT_544725 [Trichodelitschia bisporula]|uniref:Ribonuclease n=1 Tax=Trichodelitschia bisporula TaxID=703511 RepID=A0A6G1HML2_9PEZI|nr:hypothetical protein EJ06DRAFT_544725 [Trichodelitschia bisporula]